MQTVNRKKRYRNPLIKKRFFLGLQIIVAVIVTLIILFPIYWMVVSSLKDRSEMLLAVPTFWPTKGLHFENFIEVFKKVPLLRYMFNTLLVTGIEMLIQVVTGVLAAYVFAYGHFKGRDFCFLIVLGALMVPPQVTFIPLYMLIAKLGLVDTYIGLVFPNMVSAYLIFMLRQNFKSVDQSYLDAGKMDGLGMIGTITHILMPMCRPTIVTCLLISFISGWNDYFWPKILTKSDSTRLISVGLTYLKNSFEQAEVVRNFNVIMAGVLISIIPVAIIFSCCQKYMLEGYSKAAMK